MRLRTQYCTSRSNQDTIRIHIGRGGTLHWLTSINVVEETILAFTTEKSRAGTCSADIAARRRSEPRIALHVLKVQVPDVAVPISDIIHTPVSKEVVRRARRARLLPASIADRTTVPRAHRCLLHEGAADNPEGLRAVVALYPESA
eukprot:2318586-Rhodomonas_salina.1